MRFTRYVIALCNVVCVIVGLASAPVLAQLQKSDVPPIPKNKTSGTAKADGPGLEETLSWLSDRLAEWNVWRDHLKFTLNDCDMKAVDTGANDYVREIVVPLSKIDSDDIPLREARLNFGLTRIYEFRLGTRNKVPAIKVDKREHASGQVTSQTFAGYNGFRFTDKDQAERIIKAFKHAAAICRAMTGPDDATPAEPQRPKRDLF